MVAKKILTTPIKTEGLEDIHISDIAYLSGHTTTCHDVAHGRLIESGRRLPVDLEGGAIPRAGPIIRPSEDGRYEMVSVGPTTSMCMEKFEGKFARETGIHLVVGKRGMGMGTEEGCKEYKVLHCMFPANCAVVAADSMEEIKQAQWLDLGMPETPQTRRVKEFGPLTVSIDTYRRNLFEQSRVEFNEKKGKVYEGICREVHFIR